MDKAELLKQERRYAVALGMMIIRMSALEFAVSTSIAFIVRLDNALIQSMLAGEHLPTLIKMLDCSFNTVTRKRKEFESEARNEFTNIVSRLYKVNETRNHYVHTMWHFEDVSFAQAMKFKRGKSGLKYNEEKVTLNELFEFVTEITRTQADLIRFLDKYKFRIPIGTASD